MVMIDREPMQGVAEGVNTDVRVVVDVKKGVGVTLRTKELPVAVDFRTGQIDMPAVLMEMAKGLPQLTDQNGREKLTKQIQKMNGFFFVPVVGFDVSAHQLVPMGEVVFNTDNPDRFVDLLGKMYQINAKVLQINQSINAENRGRSEKGLTSREKARIRSLKGQRERLIGDLFETLNDLMTVVTVGGVLNQTPRQVKITGMLDGLEGTPLWEEAATKEETEKSWHVPKWLYTAIATGTVIGLTGCNLPLTKDSEAASTPTPTSTQITEGETPVLPVTLIVPTDTPTPPQEPTDTPTPTNTPEPTPTPTDTPRFLSFEEQFNRLINNEPAEAGVYVVESVDVEGKNEIPPDVLTALFPQLPYDPDNEMAYNQVRFGPVVEVQRRGDRVDAEATLEALYNSWGEGPQSFIYDVLASLPEFNEAALKKLIKALPKEAFYIQTIRFDDGQNRASIIKLIVWFKVGNRFVPFGVYPVAPGGEKSQSLGLYTPFLSPEGESMASERGGIMVSFDVSGTQVKPGSPSSGVGGGGNETTPTPTPNPSPEATDTPLATPTPTLPVESTETPVTATPTATREVGGVLYENLKVNETMVKGMWEVNFESEGNEYYFYIKDENNVVDKLGVAEALLQVIGDLDMVHKGTFEVKTGELESGEGLVYLEGRVAGNQQIFIIDSLDDGETKAFMIPAVNELQGSEFYDQVEIVYDNGWFWYVGSVKQKRKDGGVRIKKVAVASVNVKEVIESGGNIDIKLPTYYLNDPRFEGVPEEWRSEVEKIMKEGGEGGVIVMPWEENGVFGLYLFYENKDNVIQTTTGGVPLLEHKQHPYLTYNPETKQFEVPDEWWKGVVWGSLKNNEVIFIDLETPVYTYTVQGQQRQLLIKDVARFLEKIYSQDSRFQEIFTRLPTSLFVVEIDPNYEFVTGTLDPHGVKLGRPLLEAMVQHQLKKEYDVVNVVGATGVFDVELYHRIRMTINREYTDYTDPLANTIGRRLFMEMIIKNSVTMDPIVRKLYMDERQGFLSGGDANHRFLVQVANELWQFYKSGKSFEALRKKYPNLDEADLRAGWMMAEFLHQINKEFGVQDGVVRPEEVRESRIRQVLTTSETVRGKRSRRGLPPQERARIRSLRGQLGS